MADEWEATGNNDLRLQIDGAGGFRHVVLRDADDGDVIVVNEDDVEVLRDRLSRELVERDAANAEVQEWVGRCYIILNPPPGDHVLNAARMLFKAHEANPRIEGIYFNGKVLKIKEGETPEEMVNRYWEKSNA